MTRHRTQGPRAHAAPAALALALCAAACGRTSGEADEKLPPQVTLSGVTFHAWEGSELVARGAASQLTYDRASGDFEATGGKVSFPAPAAKAARERRVTDDLEVAAPSCRGNLARRDVLATGGVEVTSAAGLRARTPSARFEGEGLVARGDEPVEIRGPGYALDARSFVFFLLTEELVFEGGVRSALGAGVLP